MSARVTGRSRALGATSWAAPRACLVAVGLGLAALASACDGGGDSGSGGSGAGGSGGTGTGTAPPIQESCEKQCTKQAGLGCNTITEDQCKQSCPFAEENVGEACKAEWAAFYACNADLDYECMQGTAVPVGQEKCVEVSLTVSECMQKVPCTSYCKEAAAKPCGPADEEACVTQCLAETSFQNGDSCTNDLVDLRTCQGSGALDCDGDTLVTVGCEEQIYDYAWCFALDENDWCEGYCFAVEARGCAPAGIEECLLSCQEEKHASLSCDFYYEDLLECRTQQGIDCSSGSVSDEGCTDEASSYQGCVQP